ncbi:hypothetical protein [Paracoccus denitrificans]|uniref:hypothetical protein n=1 Tax=Paracoccus denitrificans TaxID=266 RepID=UPI001F3BFCCD|nr:hypothetical protein [Paracoccus denitrificans]
MSQIGLQHFGQMHQPVAPGWFFGIIQQRDAAQEDILGRRLDPQYIQRIGGIGAQDLCHQPDTARICGNLDLAQLFLACEQAVEPVSSPRARRSGRYMVAPTARRWDAWPCAAQGTSSRTAKTSIPFDRGVLTVSPHCSSTPP